MYEIQKIRTFNLKGWLINNKQKFADKWTGELPLTQGASHNNSSIKEYFSPTA